MIRDAASFGVSQSRWLNLHFSVDTRKSVGRVLLAVLALTAVILAKTLSATGVIAALFDTLRPTLCVFLVWSLALGTEQVLI